MEIVVCFKVSPELEHLTAREADEIAAGTWDSAFARPVPGACDEAALESALRLRDEAAARGMPCRLAAITAGPCQSRFFTELFALGFDRVLHAETRENLDFSPAQTARVLADAIRAAGGADLVLTGQQASPGESGLVPARLAALLDVPYLPRAAEVQCGPHGALDVTVQTEAGLARAAARLPALCAIENARYPNLRLARLKERLSAAKRQWETVPAEPLPQMPDEAARLWAQGRKGLCRFMDEATPGEQAKALLAFCPAQADGQGDAM